MSQQSKLQPPCIEPLASLLDSYLIPAVLLSPEYEILATNQHYANQESALGRHCYEVSHHYNRPCHQMGEQCPMQASLESGTVQRVLHLHHTPDGEEHVDVELHPIRDQQQRICAFVEIMRPLKTSRAENPSQPLIGRSGAFTHAMALIGRVAPSDSTVMLRGESGTGKELAALAVHKASGRAGGPFVPLECSGLSESLFESELFGHEKGAFTGAHSRKQGLVESARGGTLFLDEIGDVPLNLQVKLLRLLETGTYRRVGGLEALQAEFRLVCATHCDLEAMVAEGRFRQDLYYRISVFPITLPPLRERREDLPELARELLGRLGEGRSLQLSEAALQCLQQYDFPGNIRELRNLLERAVLLADTDLLEPAHFPALSRDNATKRPSHFNTLLPLRELEQQYLQWVIRNQPNDKSWLARQLGISERTLYRKLEDLKRTR